MRVCVCVCECMCDRERERERETDFITGSTCNLATVLLAYILSVSAQALTYWTQLLE